jgi:hypothetical protein
VNANSLTPSAHRDYDRELFAVEGLRVSHDGSRGWRCTCAAYLEEHDCPHVVQARAFRQMRGARRDDDTIEIQCNATQLQVLSQAAEEHEQAPQHIEIPPPAILARPGRERRRSSWTTVGAAAAISALSSGVTYLATTWAQATGTADQAVSWSPPPQPPPPTAQLPQDPVRFVNPFDGGEVFVFPAGTSESEARDAVAEFLLERARERAADTSSVAHTG